MVKRELVWEVSKDGMSIVPATPQDGGVQGDHNVTRVIFKVAEGSAWADPANAVYIECVDGAGNMDTTEQLSVVDDTVSYLLPRAWTQYGGVTTLRLVAEGPGVEGVQAYSPYASVRFESRQNAMHKVDGLMKGRLAHMEQQMTEQMKRAEDAAAGAAESALQANAYREGAQSYVGMAHESAQQAVNAKIVAGAAASSAVESSMAAANSATAAEQAAASAAISATAAQRATETAEKAAESVAAYSELTITPEMFGAKGDGVTDDTTAIQAALDCGGTIVFAPKTYLVNVVDMNTRLWVRSNSHIILPVGCTIKLNTSPIHDYRVLNLSGVENVCISGGGRIVGDRDTHEGHYGQAGHGIGVTASKNVVIDGIEISHCWGDCIFINDNTAIRSSNVTVQNCTLHDTRRSGIAVCGCDGFKSANNVSYNITGDPEAVDADGKPEPLLGYGIDFEAHSNLGNDNCDVFDTRIYDCTPMGITLGGVNGKVNIRNSDVMDVRVGDSVGALLLDGCVLDRLRLVAIAGLDKVQVHNCTIGRAEVNIESPDVEFHKCDFVPMGDAEMSVKFLSTGDSTKAKRLNHATFDGCYFRTRPNNALAAKTDAMFLFNQCPLDTITITNCVLEVYNQIGITVVADNGVTFTNNTVKQVHDKSGGDYQYIMNFQTRQGTDSTIVFANNTVDLKGVKNYHYKTLEAMRLFAATVYMLGNLFESTYTITSTDSATGKKYGLSAVLCKMAGAYNTKKAVVANNTVDGLFATHFTYPTTEGFVAKESNNLLLCEE